MSPPEPRPAATVVILRPAHGGGFEIFFVKRHANSGFMANAYVFPGGRVDDDDASDALLERLDGVDDAALLLRMHGLDTVRDTRAHAVAAIRETFEESGILLARRDGELVRTEGVARFAQWRDKLNARQIGFSEMVEAEDLRLGGEMLTYFAHWITPIIERKRYDTRFFVAFAPEGQESRHDDLETTDSCWLTPADALAAYQAGGFTLAPPTWRVLHDLSRVPDRAAAIEWAAAEACVPIQPELHKGGGVFVLALPGDPLHPATVGEPQPNRVVLRDGRWADA